MDSQDKQTGIFNGCKTCKTHCCLLKRRDSEMILYISGRECEQIESKIGKTDNISALSDGRIFVKTNEKGYCPFVNDKGCTLDEAKPLPCRFYPYGIMLKDGKYYLIRWTNICESFSDSNNQEEYDSIYELIYPGLEKRAIIYNAKDEGKFVIVQKVPKVYLC